MLPSFACLFRMFSMLFSTPRVLVIQFVMAEISRLTPLHP